MYIYIYDCIHVLNMPRSFYGGSRLMQFRRQPAKPFASSFWIRCGQVPWPPIQFASFCLKRWSSFMCFVCIFMSFVFYFPTTCCCSVPLARIEVCSCCECWVGGCVLQSGLPTVAHRVEHSARTRARPRSLGNVSLFDWPELFVLIFFGGEGGNCCQNHGY